MPTGTRVDPFRNFNFLVEIQGITQAGFSDCSGFGTTIESIEYREGGENTHNRQLPGKAKAANITLKWGLTNSHELFDWYTSIVKGKVDRRSGSIIVNDLDGTEKVRWNFYEAWPMKWDGPDFSAKGTDVAIETLELAVERIERA